MPSLKKDKVASISDWERTDSDQQSRIQEKVLGKLKGDLGFIDSARITVEKVRNSLKFQTTGVY